MATNIGTISEMLIDNAKHLNAKQIKVICESRPELMKKVFGSVEVRAAVKKAMKQHIRDNAWEYEESHPQLINSWIRTDEDGTSAYYTWIIEGDINNAKKVLNELGQPWEGVQIHSAYDCTGRWFRYEASFTQLSDRTFVTQTAGLDV